MTFDFTAVTPAGQRIRGRRRAESEHHLRAALQAESLREVRIRAPWWATPFLERPVGARDVALFTRLFGSLITTTGTPAEALRVLQTDMPSRRLRRVVAVLSEEVQGGVPVAEAIRRHPRVFPSVYANVVAAGERTGQLAPVLGRLAVRLTREEERKAKSRSAAVYPVCVLLIAVAIAWYMLRNVVPAFTKILLDSGVELALSTRMMIAASGLLQRSGSVVLAGMVLGAWAASRVLADPWVQDALGTVLVRVPFVGPLIEANAMAAFCGMLGLTLGSGVRTVEALALAAETIPNRRMARAVAAAVPEVAEGSTIADALKRTEVVPVLVPSVVAVGEKSGTLPHQMEQAAEFYLGEIEHLSSRVQSAAEVGVTALVAAGIGAAVLMLYLLRGWSGHSPSAKRRKGRLILTPLTPC